MKYIFFPNLSELHAENCGIAILNPGWIHPKRNLDTSVLILGKKSEVSLIEDSDPLQIAPDKFSILTAEHTHSGSQKIEEPVSYYWLHFKCSETPQILSEDDAFPILHNQTVTQTRLKNAILLPQEIPLHESKTFLELFHDLLFEQENPSFTEQKFQMLFRLMMIKINEFVLAEHITQNQDTSRHSLVYATIQFIFENLTDPNFSVKTLAEKMQYNPDYLGRLFKMVMCKSIGEYIIDQRIQYAVTRLIESNDTVAKISVDCGFYSIRNFIRQFKFRKGATPSELRLRHRTMHITNV